MKFLRNWKRWLHSRNKKFLLFCFLLLFTSCHKDNPVSVTGEDHEATETIWTTKTKMSVARNMMSATVVNETLYAIGGADINSKRLSTVEVYYPALDTASVGGK